MTNRRQKAHFWAIYNKRIDQYLRNDLEWFVNNINRKSFYLLPYSPVVVCGSLNNLCCDSSNDIVLVKAVCLNIRETDIEVDFTKTITWSDFVHSEYL